MQYTKAWKFRPFSKLTTLLFPLFSICCINFSVSYACTILMLSGVFKGRRVRHLPRAPLFGGPPLTCYARKFSLFLMKNLLFTHIMYYTLQYTLRHVLQYSAFKGAPCRNCNVQVLYFQGGPSRNCNFAIWRQFAFKGAAERNCNV